MTTQDTDRPLADEAAPYPGGADAPAYRWAFNVWAVLFLGVICVGFLNYLSTYAKSFWSQG